MVRACGMLLLALAVGGAGLPDRAAAEPKPATIRLGVLSGMFRNVPPAAVQAAATPFRDLFKTHAGVDGEVAVVDDCEALAAGLTDRTLDLGVFHGFEWAWVRDRHPDLRPLVVTIPPKKPRACIVVPQNSPAASPADLTTTRVVVPMGTKAHCHLYLGRLCETLPAGCCTAEKDGEAWSDEVLDLLVAGKCGAALIDAAALAAYQNNKPGAGKVLKILAQSDPFPPAVIAYHKDGLGAGVARNIRGGLLKTHKTPGGKAFLRLWKLEGFEDAPPGFEADLQSVLKAYPPPRAVAPPQK